jgi:hypothetical protein
MARPKKSPEEKMGETITIPVTAEQKRLITEAAISASTGGYTGWARDLLVQAAQRQLRKGAPRRR